MASQREFEIIIYGATGFTAVSSPKILSSARERKMRRGGPWLGAARQSWRKCAPRSRRRATCRLSSPMHPIPPRCVGWPSALRSRPPGSDPISSTARRWGDASRTASEEFRAEILAQIQLAAILAAGVAGYSLCVPKTMYGRRPRCKREIDYQRSVRVRSCIRPLNAAA
jgi:hypothetical protein